MGTGGVEVSIRGDGGGLLKRPPLVLGKYDSVPRIALIELPIAATKRVYDACLREDVASNKS